MRSGRERTRPDSLLSEACVPLIPIGSAAKEHGPHLRLKTQCLLAEYLKAVPPALVYIKLVSGLVLVVFTGLPPTGGEMLRSKVQRLALELGRHRVIPAV